MDAVNAEGPPDTEDPAATIAANVAAVRARIAAAARTVGRDPGSVRLVAATKTVGPDAVRTALDAGVDAVGENRAQELLEKAPALTAPGRSVPWHFIGRLQRNKVRALAPWIACWESVDRIETGAAIARHAPGAVVFIQVNVGEEPQKGGCPPDGVGALVDDLHGVGLDVRGLMAVPPQGVEPGPYFDAVVARAEELGLPERSIGMTGDFEAAVAAGATLVRVGKAIFGARTGSPRPPTGPADR